MLTLVFFFGANCSFLPGICSGGGDNACLPTVSVFTFTVVFIDYLSLITLYRQMLTLPLSKLAFLRLGGGNHSDFPLG